MKHVRREELLDWQTWSDQRAEIQPKVMEVKRRRRVHLGEHLTFLFENADTVRYQVQEMMRVERIVREAEIAHELETYNGILGGEGELGCTLLVEIDDEKVRDVKLRSWRGMPERLYVKLADGRKVYAGFDERQRNEERISSVQFLKFATGGEVPVAIGADHPELTLESALTDEQKTALREDLAS